MEGHTLDHYEERLYSVFKSFDVNNEEALDKTAVHDLCDALQLEERGAALVDTLFDRSAGRVTFAQFRSGLLTVLGEQAPAPPSDDDSSGREVAPRFVFGSKKYGRRSRPHSGERPAARAASASRLADEPARPRTRRSASAMEARALPDLEHDARVDRGRALALCRDLRMDGIDARLVDRVFDDARAPDTTVGEFFERLNATLASTVDEAAAGAPASLPQGRDDDDESNCSIPAEAIIEAWEAAGVGRPRRLLADLGFASGGAVDAVRFELALDEERRAAPDDVSLAAASVAAARLIAARTAARAARLAAERDKLRIDVAAGERRARLLAHEVDESQARLEAELQETLRRAEARHAEESRRTAREAAAEVERAAGERARLEGEVARRDEAEARLRAELAAAAARADRAEARAAAAETAAAVARRERDEVAEEARAAEERAAKAAEAAANAEGLAAQLAEVVQENSRLRERAEELAAELAAPRPALAPVIDVAAAGNLSLELQAAQAIDIECRAGDGDVSTSKDASLVEDDDEKQKLIEIIKELESSLEAMRAEYESCEEYWSRKVAGERAAHEAEAAAERERLAALAARVADFERRLRPPPPTLPPIAEQPHLEQQVCALEAEVAAARRRAARGCGRCARSASRAAAAARRLAARLAAADMLVKDLYLDNCRLDYAHATARLPPHLL